MDSLMGQVTNMRARRLFRHCAIIVLSAAVARSKELQGYRCSDDVDCNFPGCNDQPCAEHEDDELCQNGVWAVKCVSICAQTRVARCDGAATEGPV